MRKQPHKIEHTLTYGSGYVDNTAIPGESTMEMSAQDQNTYPPPGAAHSPACLSSCSTQRSQVKLGGRVTSWWRRLQYNVGILVYTLPFRRYQWSLKYPQTAWLAVVYYSRWNNSASGVISGHLNTHKQPDLQLYYCDTVHTTVVQLTSSCIIDLVSKLIDGCWWHPMHPAAADWLWVVWTTEAWSRLAQYYIDAPIT